MLNIKSLLYLNVILLISFCANAQTYWQQRADYNIEAKLDDIAKTVSAKEIITYHNNSPDTLRELYIHLWANAYHGRSTPFAEQQIRNGNLKFQFAPEADLGFMDSIDFKINNAQVSWEFTDNSKEIARLTLQEPLLPGHAVQVSTPFNVKLPVDFSRMGWSNGGFQITQWYPKMAVYDRNGWNIMHYLDQGEFYSDFGNYDVSITVHVDMVVAATGELQTESEVEWLRERERLSRNFQYEQREKLFPRDTSNATKTIQYTIENAIDFAWFANKDYLVRSEDFMVKGRNDTITAWAFYTFKDGWPSDRPWVRAVKDVVNSVKFYSEKVGPYPYRNVTAVSGALSAGGGMEYPTITVISDQSDLPTVILHEVGHNWFQAILATNERQYPWMDEGINSYYENRFTANKSKPEQPELTPGEVFKEEPLTRDPFNLIYVVEARQQLDQPESLPASDFSYINYGVVVYGKVARDFKMLAAFLGQEEFDRIMQEYFQAWKFKHPRPEDLEQIFKANAIKEVSWFFDEMLTTNQNLDYAVKKVRQDGDSLQVTIKKKGDQYAPVLLNVIRNDSIIYQRWVEDVRQTTTLTVPVTEYQKVQINPGVWVPDMNVKNNESQDGFPLRVRPFFSFEAPRKHTLLVAPALGSNVYDNFMLGAAFYNTLLPPCQFQYAVAPMYGFGSDEVVGLGEVRYNFYKNPLMGKALNIWQQVQLGLQAKSFHYMSQGTNELRYLRLSPYIQGNYRPKPLNRDVEWTSRLRAVWVQKDVPQYIAEPGIVQETTILFEQKTEYKNGHALHPTEFNLTFQYLPEDPFLKVFGEVSREWIYNAKKKGVKLRLFGGAFAYGEANSGIYNFRVGSKTGPFDYTYDHLYFDRSAFPYQDFWSQQIVLSDGGFKLASNIGNTSQWLVSANLRADWPWVLPLKPYGSIATFNDAGEIYYEAGIALILVEDVAELYLPLFYNSRIREAIDLNTGTYWAQITWMLNFHKLNPLNSVKFLERLF